MPKKIKYNPADRIADLAVVRMQDRIKEIYAEAERDISRKLDEFTRKFEQKDAQFSADVKAGKRTQAEYDSWRRGQMFQSQQWKAAKKEMTQQMYKANQTAAGIINGERRVVFQQNANYSAYQIEKDTKGAVNFELYDSATVTRLLKEDKKLLPEYKVNEKKDYKWNNTKVNNAVTQSIIQGESIPELKKRLTHSLEAGNRSPMMSFARTAMTGAQNAGRIEAMHDAEDMGIKVQKRWIATLDSRTRDTHAELDGQVVDVDEPFTVMLDGDDMEIMFPGDPNADPALVYNCFIGETNIATDSKIIRSYKHDYSGKLIEVETSSGVKFTCTPNHPILTPSGWVPAALMNNGDNLLIASVRNGCGLRRNGNIQHIHARMKALYNALHRVGLMSRDSTLRVDFHGDTPTADVEVITKKWHLRGNGDSSSADSVDKFLLENSDKSLMSKGASVQHFGRVRLAALRFVRGFCKVPAFFGRGLAHAVIHGFGTVARNDTAILEPQADSMTGDMQFLRESLDRFPGKVFVDNIVNINITTVSHIPVYNLQTGNSRYFVNTIIEQNGEKCNGNFAIAHNCRCTLGYEYPDVATGIGRRRDNETSDKIEGMTYKEWEKMKQGEGENNSNAAQTDDNDFNIRYAEKPQYTDEEASALHDYTTSSYSGINSLLIEGGLENYPDAKRTVDKIDSAMDKSELVSPITVSRGERMNGLQTLFPDMKRRWLEDPEKLRQLEGRTAPCPQFISTTAGEKVSEAFSGRGLVWHYEVDDGVNAIDMSRFASTAIRDVEREVLIDRDVEVIIDRLDIKTDSDGDIVGDVIAYARIRGKHGKR